MSRFKQNYLQEMIQELVTVLMPHTTGDGDYNCIFIRVSCRYLSDNAKKIPQ